MNKWFTIRPIRPSLTIQDPVAYIVMHTLRSLMYYDYCQKPKGYSQTPLYTIRNHGPTSVREKHHNLFINDLCVTTELKTSL